jgi:hypothetical protein
MVVKLGGSLLQMIPDILKNMSTSAIFSVKTVLKLFENYGNTGTGNIIT